MRSTLILFFLIVVSLANAQERPKAEDFLGYEIGTHFTYYHQVVDYFKEVATKSDRVEFIQYGETWERRPQVAAIISAPENLKNLETIRRNNLIRAGKIQGEPGGKEAVIVWLMYNIHGDEASGTEAALWTLEKLSSGDPEINKWLEDVVVLIDPCENPDGRDRYANWFNQVGNSPFNPQPETAEHSPPWPGGRVNHYLFDLNRDWAWQTQVESQNRAALYHQWMPQVHIDLHEMGYNDPYFFAPAAVPFHEVITPWQRDFQSFVGKNNSKYFDENGWLFYTAEIFDLLYPSYGDTWPTYQGAIGLTYERGGSRGAGTHVITERGDTLTLKERAEQHMTTSLATIETAYTYRNKLLEEFSKFFDNAVSKPTGAYKAYVVKASNNAHKVKAFTELLDKQSITYEFAAESGASLNGFDYLSGRVGPFKVESGDLVISAFQPQSTLLKVLMEPETILEDSLTYDLTAWALPYVYDLDAYACKDRIKVKTKESKAFVKNEARSKGTYAILAQWEDLTDARFLAGLFKNGIKVRHARKSFTHEGKDYGRGTLVITAADNRFANPDFVQTVTDIANALEIDLHYTNSGYTEGGIDLGSEYVPYLKAPKVATFRGDGVGTSSFGEIWYYFEKVLEYPIHVLDTDDAGRIDLSKYDVLILPSGYYSSNELDKKIISYGENGGTIIALEQAIRMFSTANTGLAEALKNKEKDKKDVNPSPESLLNRYEDSERKSISNYSAGSIYRVTVDNSHPLAYGFGEETFTMKRSSSTYPYLPNGWNVGALKTNGLVSGFVGQNLKKDLDHSLAFGVDRIGGGKVVYFVDSPVFRGFWYNGNLLMGNAIFLVGQ